MFVHVELNACGLDSLTVKQNLLATASNVDFTYTIPDKHVCVWFTQFERMSQTNIYPNIFATQVATILTVALWSLKGPLPTAGWP